MYDKKITSISKGIFIAFILLGCIAQSSAQFHPQNFGKGFQVIGKDSTFYLKFGFRFQSLYTGEWSLTDDKLSNAGDYETAFLIRRSRLKFSGFAYSTKLKYKIELGLSNRDHGGENIHTNNT